MDIVLRGGAVVGVYSFTTGLVHRKFTPRPASENEVQCAALWLENHDRADDAEMLIDWWCKGKTLYVH